MSKSKFFSAQRKIAFIKMSLERCQGVPATTLRLMLLSHAIKAILTPKEKKAFML